MKEIFTILVVLLFAFPLQAGTLYKWVDKQGVVNFTDDLTKVPPSYRNQVEVEESKDVQEEKAPLSPKTITPSSKEDETVTDIYGRDEVWWRDKVRPWKEKLKEATEKYEEVQENFTKKAEELSQTKFLYRSKSSTPWEVGELNRMSEEKKMYEAQIAEANEMLRKLSKEAEESKANPEWLK